MPSDISDALEQDAIADSLVSEPQQEQAQPEEQEFASIEDYLPDDVQLAQPEQEQEEVEQAAEEEDPTAEQEEEQAEEQETQPLEIDPNFPQFKTTDEYHQALRSTVEQNAEIFAHPEMAQRFASDLLTAFQSNDPMQITKTCSMWLFSGMRSLTVPYMLAPSGYKGMNNFQYLMHQSQQQGRQAQGQRQGHSQPARNSRRSQSIPRMRTNGDLFGEGMQIYRERETKL